MRIAGSLLHSKRGTALGIGRGSGLRGNEEACCPGWEGPQERAGAGRLDEQLDRIQVPKLAGPPQALHRDQPGAAREAEEVPCHAYVPLAKGEQQAVGAAVCSAEKQLGAAGREEEAHRLEVARAARNHEAGKTVRVHVAVGRRAEDSLASGLQQLLHRVRAPEDARAQERRGAALADQGATGCAVGVDDKFQDFGIAACTRDAEGIDFGGAVYLQEGGTALTN